MFFLSFSFVRHRYLMHPLLQSTCHCIVYHYLNMVTIWIYAPHKLVWGKFWSGKNSMFLYEIELRNSVCGILATCQYQIKITSIHHPILSTLPSLLSIWKCPRHHQQLPSQTTTIQTTPNQFSQHLWWVQAAVTMQYPYLSHHHPIRPQLSNQQTQQHLGEGVV